MENKYELNRDRFQDELDLQLINLAATSVSGIGYFSHLVLLSSVYKDTEMQSKCFLLDHTNINQCQFYEPKIMFHQHPLRTCM